MNLQNKSMIAIMGPSGAGKTTLGDKLYERHEISIPTHCTTRNPRNDDRTGFYRYLSHEEYYNLLCMQKFLISSGDGPIVKKEFGSFYGILIEDCIEAWKKNDVIVVFVSYKDIETLIKLKSHNIDIDIVNITYIDIEANMKDRLVSDYRREHSESDLHKRINSAICDKGKYGKALNLYAKTTVYTDVLGIEDTYNKVCEDLGLTR